MTIRFGRKNNIIYDGDDLRGLDFISRRDTHDSNRSTIETVCIWLPPRRQKELANMTNTFYSDILDEIVDQEAMFSLNIDNIKNIVFTWATLQCALESVFGGIPHEVIMRDNLNGLDDELDEDTVKDMVDEWYNEAVSDLFEVYRHMLYYHGGFREIGDKYPVHDWVHDIFMEAQEYIYDSFHGILSYLVDELRDVPGFHMFVTDGVDDSISALLMSICDFTIREVSNTCDLVVVELPLYN